MRALQILFGIQTTRFPLLYYVSQGLLKKKKKKVPSGIAHAASPTGLLNLASVVADLWGNKKKKKGDIHVVFHNMFEKKKS